MTLRALGTAFNVRLERKAVDVLVTHGRVQVTPAGRTGQLLEESKRCAHPKQRGSNSTLGS